MIWLSDGFLEYQKFWSAILQFEHFHGLITPMAVVKRSVINCSACFNITGEVFYMLWPKVLTDLHEQSDHIVCKKV